MMNSILGFNQEYLMRIRNEKKSEKEINSSITLDDLLVLRWFTDKFYFFEKCIKGNEVYAYVDCKELAKDIPFLNISQWGARRRLSKLCEFGLLKSADDGKVEKVYGLGKAYEALIGFSCDREKTGNESGGKLEGLSSGQREDKSDKELDRLLNEKYDEWFKKTYEIYPRKASSVKCKKTFINKIRSNREDISREIALKIYKSLKVQIMQWAAENNGNGRERQYYPFMSTWLNANFEDMK